ncbi:MAG: MBL fold metallo-hydrolase, partial [Betaproteobacteria bacterium]|nr:MBL fold metallo-hydrolase [Betaproteobacteria bacterium]
MSAIFHRLSPALTVIERGWLNCNQIVLAGAGHNVLIDSGYGRHAQVTLHAVNEALAGQPLHWLINTHCHSDHMGGNCALRERYGCRVTIPQGEVRHVVPWTEQSCWSEQMDQYAEEFGFDDTFGTGDTFIAGGLEWRAVAAPGHDMDALMYHAEETGVLITGDALWQRGMGFVWPQVDAMSGRNLFIDTALATLDTIAQLAPRLIVPGHGAPFAELAPSLDHARAKLLAFAREPAKNARHVVKGLFVFALLDRGAMQVADGPGYLRTVPVYGQMCRDYLGMDETALA